MYFLSLAAAGCVVVKNREEIAFLQGLAASQKEMQTYVTGEEELFNRLVLDIKNNRLKEGMPKNAILSLYGEPIFCKASEKDNTGGFCFYRHPYRYFSGNSVYLYFDENENLNSWRLVTQQ